MVHKLDDFIIRMRDMRKVFLKLKFSKYQHEQRDAVLKQLDDLILSAEDAKVEAIQDVEEGDLP